MSEMKKNVPIWSEGGGSKFFKNVWNSKMSQMLKGGGGVNPNWDMSQIFSLFYFDASPKWVTAIFMGQGKTG